MSLDVSRYLETAPQASWRRVSDIVTPFVLISTIISNNARHLDWYQNTPQVRGARRRSAFGCRAPTGADQSNEDVSEGSVLSVYIGEPYTWGHRGGLCMGALHSSLHRDNMGNTLPSGTSSLLWCAPVGARQLRAEALRRRAPRSKISQDILLRRLKTA